MGSFCYNTINSGTFQISSGQYPNTVTQASVILQVSADLISDPFKFRILQIQIIVTFCSGVRASCKKLFMAPFFQRPRLFSI